MSAYLISGPSGSGKTTLGEALAHRGYRVIDTDHAPGLSDWFDNTTGEKITEIPAYPYTEDWLKNRSWGWDAAVMHKLLGTTANRPVFFVGGAHNERDFFSLFAQRFGLHTDDVTLKQRLLQRQPDRYGNNSPELLKQLEWNRKFEAYCASIGAILIDSSGTPDVIADSLLTHVH
jgi:hypothetical protein